MEPQSLSTHLIELRDKIIKVLCAVAIVFLSLFYFAKNIYSFIATPLMEHLPNSGHMIATEITSPFLAPLKLTLYTAIFITMPYSLNQLWKFIAPGLYQNEKNFALPLLISSSVLFYAGIAFAYFVVFPLIFPFFSAVSPEGIVVMPDINRYLDFVLKIFFAFGIAFEVPVATVLLIWSGFLSLEKLKKNRAYIIVISFVLGMLLTPPDIISQILLAIPIWLLFEAGLWYAQKFPQSKAEEPE